MYLYLGKGEKRKMAIYKVKVIRRGTIIVDDVESLEDAEEYIESCNPIDEVRWSDFLETMDGGMEQQKISIPEFMTVEEVGKKIEVHPSEIIKRLFLDGKCVNCSSVIMFEDIKNIAAEYGFICEKETLKELVND